ncbi:MAG TPA: methylated-DNA--[protein]-cysteine S-methyltransferase [Noviherbaspirillum sp.]|uniref:methylated-DNA--[protein]-cysteine S-methyltransferase n=1 Tax=Noviherbaspirillum sp. TaxID=1926288 RepID=UPI002DDDB86F|nr:methylated-DNA--[protein]-cysteine S-methyltransferase [Noviherbaspirillum sp.]HEV2612117.1 methylated-DNA--[protein]-cysteine S-methyltransferase [Noviherbaspirillum sp.]
MYYMEHDSPVGRLTLTATDKGLSGLYFEEHKYFTGTQDRQRQPDQIHLRDARQQLDEYFRQQRTRFDVPLDLQGTPFQRAVWQALLTLPFGHTSTYSMIAQHVARPNAVRAAGTAIGRNPLSIIVPCHRVLGMSGALSGYAGGLERKRFLLELEKTMKKTGGADESLMIIAA